MAKTVTLHGNQLAKGYNNYAELTNIELQAVGGNVPDPYLLAVDDLAAWLDGVDRVDGEGITQTDGFSSTQWQAGAMSFSQWFYLYTSILGGARSGKVTMRTRRYAVPMNDTMGYFYVIANAILTLLPVPAEDRGDYIAGFEPFFYRFTRIEILHEDKMKGTLYATAASTAQNGITTAAEKLTAFTTSGLNAGVTTSASDDSHTIDIAEDYTCEAVISFTAEASVKWSFQFYVDAAAVGPLFITETNATPDAEFISMKWQQAMDATDVVTVYVKSDEGGGKNITVTDAIFTVESI